MNGNSFISTLPLLTAAAILAGCASGFPGARPLTYSTPGESRIFVSPGKCPHDKDPEEAAGIIAALLTGVASQLLTNFGTALQKGAEGGNLPNSVATLNMSLQPGAIPRCIVIIRGAFDKDSRNPTAVSLETVFDGTRDLERTSRLASFHFVPIYRVDHLIEIQVVSSSNSKALTFAPIFVRLDRSIDGARDGERDISVALKFNRAGNEGVGSAVLIADRPVGQTPTQQERHPATQRFPREAPWFGTFHAAPAAADSASAPPVAASAVASGAAGAIPSIGAPTGATPSGSPATVVTTLFSKEGNSVPVTLTATVVETRPTNEGLAFIASVFNAIKPKLEEAIKPIIDPSISDAADQTAAAAALDAEAGFSLAFRSAEVAVLAYCTGASKELTPAGRSDRLTKSSDARIAQFKANAAAVKMGKASPYSFVISTSADLPTAANGCP